MSPLSYHQFTTDLIFCFDKFLILFWKGTRGDKPAGGTCVTIQMRKQWRTRFLVPSFFTYYRRIDKDLPKKKKKNGKKFN